MTDTKLMPNYDYESLKIDTESGVVGTTDKQTKKLIEKIKEEARQKKLSQIFDQTRSKEARIYAPEGHVLRADKRNYLRADRPAEILRFCLQLFEDKRMIQLLKKSSHKQRVDFLVNNGFKLVME